MWIHYNVDGNYESFSNSNAKNVNAFLNKYEFITFKSNVKLKHLGTLKDVVIHLDVNSLCEKVNLDCKNCSKLFDMECADEIYPFEILLNINEKFIITEILIFVDTEDTRLISIYGKHGHLNHCVTSDLNNSPYIKYSKQIKCNKNKYFKISDYEYSYIALKDKILEVLDKNTYSEICKHMNAYIKDLSKIGSLF